MKQIVPYFLVCILAITSCSKDEVGLNEDKTLLKSFKVVKNLDGRYSIDYTTNSNVTSEVVKNIKTKSNDIYLFSGKGAKRGNFSEALLLEGDLLKVGFLENSEKRKSIFIEDKNIVLAKGVQSTEYLEQYSIEDLGNDEYELRFSVREGVKTSFKYNEILDIYEVHLQKGISDQRSFAKKYLKTSKSLKIDFVNYLENNTAARQVSVVGYRADRPRRPRAIVQD